MRDVLRQNVCDAPERDGMPQLGDIHAGREWAQEEGSRKRLGKDNESHLYALSHHLRERQIRSRSSSKVTVQTPPPLWVR